jgi:methionyl-tRNA formyltransferase
VLEPERLREAAAEIEALAPDLFVVVSYGKIVPASLLALPRCGLAFNIHPSLLPLYRGATPLQSVLRDGRSETGVTIIAMDAGMDTGDILVQERTVVGATETYGQLHDRLAQDGARLLGLALEELEHGTLERRPQAGLAPDAEIAATLTRPWRKEDFALDWHRDAHALVNQIRSLAPQPLARAMLGGVQVKIAGAHATEQPSDPTRAGEIAGTEGDAVLVFAGRGAVAVERLVPPSRGPIDGGAFARTLRTAI